MLLEECRDDDVPSHNNILLGTIYVLLTVSEPRVTSFRRRIQKRQKCKVTVRGEKQSRGFEKIEDETDLEGANAKRSATGQRERRMI